MVATDFDEDADTFVTGAVPLLDPEDETTPRRILCADCLSPAMPGGALATTVTEWERVTASKACLRGASWAWCATQTRLSIWFKQPG